MTLTADEIRLVEKQRGDPLFAAYDLLGWEPKYPKQEEILRSVWEYPETHVVSANGVGKTDIAAVVVLLYALTRRCIIITTANTWTQVATVLWERIRKIAAEAPEDLGIVFNNTQLQLGEQWFAMGLSTRDEARFAGYHEEEQLVIVEEAVGLPGPMWDAIDGILVGSRDRLLGIGNPLTRNCAWFQRVRAAERDPDANVIHVSAYDTPNVATGREVVPGMTTLGKVLRNIRKWGEGDPRTEARVHGRWPEGGESGLYPLSWLARAFDYSGEFRPGPKVAGLDVARYGSDESALAVRHGNRLVHLSTWQGAPTTETAGKAVRVMDGYDPDPLSEAYLPCGPVEEIRIDSTGLGAGPFDNVEEASRATLARQEVLLTEWHNGASPSDPLEFGNFMDEAHWHFRGLLERGEVDLSVLSPEEREEIEGMALATGYKLDSKGRRKVSDKEAIRKVIKRSPDPFEALVMAFWDEPAWEPDEDLSSNVGPYGDKKAPGTIAARRATPILPEPTVEDPDDGDDGPMVGNAFGWDS